MGVVYSKIKSFSNESSDVLALKPLAVFKQQDTIRVKHKLKLAKNKLQNILKKGFKTTSWILWVTGVSVVVLVTPIAFQYEKECQLFEMQAQFLQAQQAANVPQLN
ncbi:mitochondrial import receptor subunit TOM22, putative [Hepatocystis sp. ex Piliocolobus tephrosceles]|nr:mitochondrial import receptor subunit TOM22, putative [Hepatocystis sp. ex Piliocolobus tephrosceles]